MCGSELIPKPQGLTATDKHLRAQARRIVDAAAQTADVVASPCVSVCRMSDDTGFCVGCWRSLEEIAQWAASSPDSKRGVWRNIAQRIDAAR